MYNETWGLVITLLCPIKTMSLKESYPNVEQWVSNCGTLEIRTIKANNIEIALGDAGGIPGDGYLIAESVDEALKKADLLLQNWLEETKRLLDNLKAGDPRITEEEFLQVPGWPKVKNPYYEKNGA